MRFTKLLSATLTFLGCALLVSACDLEAYDETGEDESALSRPSIAGLGGFNGGFGTTQPTDPYEHCDVEFDACIQSCDADKCLLRCEMAYENCIDDVNGDGGPVDPIWVH